MYGLEPAQLNDSIKKYIDTFQLKGLRKILNLEHTYLDRENTNKKIDEEAEKGMNIGNKGKYKTLEKLSKCYDTQRMKTLSQIIHLKDTEDTRVNITFDKHTFRINEYNKKRIGRPKFAWWKYAMEDLWFNYQKTNETHRYTDMNLDNPDHIEIIKQVAKNNFEEQQQKRKNKQSNTEPTTPSLPNGPTHETGNTNTTINNTSNTETAQTQPQAANIYTFPEFENLDEEIHKPTFKQTLTLYNRHNKTILRTRIIKEQDTFKQQLEKHNFYNNHITNTQFSNNHGKLDQATQHPGHSTTTRSPSKHT